LPGKAPGPLITKNHLKIYPNGGRLARPARVHLGPSATVSRCHVSSIRCPPRPPCVLCTPRGTMVRESCRLTREIRPTVSPLQPWEYELLRTEFGGLGSKQSLRGWTKAPNFPCTAFPGHLR